MGERLGVVLVVLSITACTDDAGESAPAAPEGSNKPRFALDECGLRTGYAGDEFCILPPPPDKGFQVHIGPTDYGNPDPSHVINPGAETSELLRVVSGNDHDVFVFFRQYRVRPAFHHLSLTTTNERWDFGHIIGIASGSKDFPSGGIIAPEDRGVGVPLAANSLIAVSFHAINTTDRPTVREAWVNFWYRDPNEISEPALLWFHNGDPSAEIQPYQSITLGPYHCTVEGDGRLLWLYGHRHANNVRFTVTRVRGAERAVIYDAYNWQDPLLLEYSSLITNPAPDYDKRIEGGWSGILDLKNGDQIEWQCDVVNKRNIVLHSLNETYDSEMCVMDAEAVGAACNRP